MPMFKLKIKPKVRGQGTKKKTAGMYQTKWRDDMAFRVYDLFKAGMNETETAALMGVRSETLRKWMANKPIVRAARAAALAAKEAEDSVAGSFQDYVYSRLPADLRPVWDDIMAAGETDDPVERIEAALKGKGMRGRQYMFVQALLHNNYNISEASRMTNISARTFELWMRKDPDFAAVLDVLKVSKKDMVEEKLMQLVRSGDTAAVLFANRSINKDRGYGDTKTVKVDQAVTHTHLIDIEELDLTLEVRQAILTAMRKQRSPNALGLPVDVVTALPRVRQPVHVIDAVQEAVVEEEDE